MTTENLFDPTERIGDGYEGTNIPDDFSIPSCGIEDVDEALFNKFNSEIGFSVEYHGKVHDVPVIFAGGERFAMIKRKDPIRDKNGTLILPLISIYRSAIDQSPNLGGLGRGLGQDTGTLTIKRRLSAKDRDYQRLKNKLALENQEDVASENNRMRSSPPQGNNPGTLATRRATGARFDLRESGHLLDADLGDNIFEIISIPYPQFFRATYDITFWTQHIQHMNGLIEQMMMAYNIQHNHFRIVSPKGYWFEAFIDDNIQASDNFKDYAMTERIVKHTFTVQTTGYVIATQHAGQPNPFRKYLSSPQVSFGIKESRGTIISPRPLGAGSGDPDPFTLSDISELDKQGEPIVGRNHSPYKVETTVEDPFTGEESPTYTRILTRNQRVGEVVARLTDLDKLLLD